MNITDEDINEYYMENQEEFKTPATVKARHILIKVDADAAPEAVEKARIKASDILKMAVEGGDFADLAKKYSECPSKDNLRTWPKNIPNAQAKTREEISGVLPGNPW
ncbi:MAG: peptidyl-prolyl cis-trans isomerase [Deltaproteobacteria bacterium]|nr:peptidyl-prolyl cis-trans isomerase [Deltaproteobacteria bacterium]